MNKQKAKKGRGQSKRVAVIPFNPGKEFFPNIYRRPEAMDRIFRIYRRMI
jgi:hypothetical protein